MARGARAFVISWLLVLGIWLTIQGLLGADWVHRHELFQCGTIVLAVCLAWRWSE